MRGHKKCHFATKRKKKNWPLFHRTLVPSLVHSKKHWRPFSFFEIQGAWIKFKLFLLFAKICKWKMKLWPGCNFTPLLSTLSLKGCNVAVCSLVLPLWAVWKIHQAVPLESVWIRAQALHWPHTPHFHQSTLSNANVLFTKTQNHSNPPSPPPLLQVTGSTRCMCRCMITTSSSPVEFKTDGLYPFQCSFSHWWCETWPLLCVRVRESRLCPGALTAPGGTASAPSTSEQLALYLLGGVGLKHRNSEDEQEEARVRRVGDDMHRETWCHTCNQDCSKLNKNQWPPKAHSEPSTAGLSGKNDTNVFSRKSFLWYKRLVYEAFDSLTPWEIKYRGVLLHGLHPEAERLCGDSSVPKIGSILLKKGKNANIIVSKSMLAAVNKMWSK